MFNLEEPQPILARMRNAFSRIDDELDTDGVSSAASMEEIEHLIGLLKEDFANLETSIQLLVLRSQSRTMNGTFGDSISPLD